MKQEEKDKLLEEAIKRYPVGTIVKCPIFLDTYTVRNGVYLFKEVEKIGRRGQRVIVDNSPLSGNYLYVDGKWAEIISAPEEKTINTYGLKVGDKLPVDILNQWMNEGLNRYTTSWTKERGCHIGDRVIENIEVKDGVVAFRASGSASWARAEGFKDFMIKNNKPKFEVGKWYTHPKWSPNSYIKFHSIRDYNSVNELERISQGFYKKEANWSISYEHTLVPVDLSEIQPYLPEGHPDKIKVMKVKNQFEIGDIIDTDNTGYQYTNMIDNSKKDWCDWKCIKNCNCRTASHKSLKVLDKVYSIYTNSWWYQLTDYINWVSENCMSLSKTEKVVPEYVECIKVPNGWTITKLGDIYKTDSYGNGTYRLVWPDGSGQTTVGVESHFKPSTKEAYDKQQSLKSEEQWIPKVGDWVKEAQTRYNIGDYVNVWAAKAEPHEIPTESKPNLNNSKYKIGTEVRVTTDRSKDYQKTGWWVKAGNYFQQILGVCGGTGIIEDIKIINSNYYYKLGCHGRGFIREDLLELIRDSDILEYPATPNECIPPSNPKFKVTIKTEEETKIKIKVKQSIKI